MKASDAGSRPGFRLLILGAGGMAANHARRFAEDPRVQIVAAVDTDPQRLSEFSASRGIAGTFPDLDSALAWGGFDAVSNVTPDAVHHPTTMKLLAAGKHVFCEKPLAENHELSMEMTEAAEAAGLINMVNLTYRGVAEVQKARQIVAEGALGRIRQLRGEYLQSWLVGRYWGDWRTEDKWLWRLSSAHGSAGALGDIGIHILDTALFVSGLRVETASGRLFTFDKSDTDRIGDYVLDANDAFMLMAGLSGGAVGIIEASRVATGYGNRQNLSIFGDLGGMELTFGIGGASLRICVGDDIHERVWKPVDCPAVPDNYRRFADAVCSGVNGDPDFRRAAALQRIIDLCRESDARGGSALTV